MIDRNTAFPILAAMAAALSAGPLAAQADMSAFRPGPVFTGFGPHAPVEGVDDFPADTEFRVAFDVAAPADAGTRNRGFESAARFINMHAAHGIDPDNMDAAVVVHGKAVKDLVADSGSAMMVRDMLAQGVRFIVCGQSAAGQGIAKADLIEGVEMELSAMTAHALLQQRGYTVNPF